MTSFSVGKFDLKNPKFGKYASLEGFQPLKTNSMVFTIFDI